MSVRKRKTTVKTISPEPADKENERTAADMMMRKPVYTVPILGPSTDDLERVAEFKAGFSWAIAECIVEGALIDTSSAACTGSKQWLSGARIARSVLLYEFRDLEALQEVMEAFVESSLDRWAEQAAAEVAPETKTAPKTKKTGRVPTEWIVRGVRYPSAPAAAKAEGVSPKTVRRWCKGYTVDGVYHEREKGCYTEVVKTISPEN